MMREEAKQRALLAALAIGGDIMDRRGIGHEWAQIGPDTQAEIIEEWAEMITRAMAFGEADS
jgi:hypothetical protein